MVAFVTKPPRFHVIDGTPEPESPASAVKRRVKAMPGPAEMFQCPRCGGREFIETITGAMKRGGKRVGGSKALICVTCLAAGARVAIL